jgi:hypothetical protein
MNPESKPHNTCSRTVFYSGKRTEEKRFIETKGISTYHENIKQNHCYIDNWAHVSVKSRSYIYMRATFYLLKEGIHIQLEVLVVNSTPYSLLELLHHFLLV